MKFTKHFKFVASILSVLSILTITSCSDEDETIGAASSVFAVSSSVSEGDGLGIGYNSGLVNNRLDGSFTVTLEILNDGTDGHATIGEDYHIVIGDQIITETTFDVTVSDDASIDVASIVTYVDNIDDDNEQITLSIPAFTVETVLEDVNSPAATVEITIGPNEFIVEFLKLSEEATSALEIPGDVTLDLTDFFESEYGDDATYTFELRQDDSGDLADVTLDADAMELSFSNVSSAGSSFGISLFVRAVPTDNFFSTLVTALVYSPTIEIVDAVILEPNFTSADGQNTVLLDGNSGRYITTVNFLTADGDDLEIGFSTATDIMNDITAGTYTEGYDNTEDAADALTFEFSDYNGIEVTGGTVVVAEGSTTGQKVFTFALELENGERLETTATFVVAFQD